MRDMPQAAIDKAIAAIEPLPDSAAVASAMADPTRLSLPLDQLEALHTRGQAVRSALATHARLEGNEAFKRAAAATDDAKYRHWGDAMEQYGIVVGDLAQAEVGFCNLAAVMLASKK